MSEIEIGTAGPFSIGSILFEGKDGTLHSLIKMSIPENCIGKDGVVHNKHPKWEKYEVTPIEEYCTRALVWETFLIGLAQTAGALIGAWYDRLAFHDPVYSAIIKGED